MGSDCADFTGVPTISVVFTSGFASSIPTQLTDLSECYFDGPSS